MKKEVKSVPDLRFTEFDNDWEVKKLRDISRIQRGRFSPRPRNDPAYYGGDIPFVQTSDVVNSNGRITCYSQTLNEKGLAVSKLFPKGTILITIAANIGFTGVLQIDMACPDSLIGIGCKENISNNDFLNVFLSTQQRRMNYLAPEGAQKNINIDFLEPYRIPSPTLQEQQKIASFLSAVDKKIEQLTRKKELLVQYKKGVMQKIFSREIRFKDDNGQDYPDWEEKRLGDIFERITRKNKENNQNVLTISAQQGLINQQEYFKKSVSAVDVTGYYLLRKGDFSYNKSYSKGYPMGAIKRLNRYAKGVVSTLYICFVIKRDDIPEYFEEFLDFGGINRELHKIAQEGARNHGLLNMSVIEFFNDITFLAPSIVEQKKIAGFLNSLSLRIESARKQLKNTHNFRKGLLQKMFV